MQVKKLIKEFDRLQCIHGDKTLDAVYGAGETNSPRLCLVFMNPTGRNTSSSRQWAGLKAPWIGTKNVWRMFFQLGLFDKELFSEISQRKPEKWDYGFAQKVYSRVSESSVYITNLSKATQKDARPLKNSVFREYISLFREEISLVKPEKIISFGNQVSSIILGKSIRVSDYRKKHEEIMINGQKFTVFPVFYPIGQGQRNLDKARKDVEWVMKSNITPQTFS